MAKFHDAALAHGAPPLQRMPELLGWPAPGSKPTAAAAPADDAAASDDASSEAAAD